MSDILPRNILYAFILFSIVVVGMFSLFLGVASDNPTMIDNGSDIQAFNNTINKYQSLSEASTKLQSGIGNPEENDWGVLGVVGSLIGTSYNAIKSLFSTIDFIGITFNSLQGYFGIPWYITSAISMFIVFVVAFAIYSVVFQGGKI